MYRGSDFTTKTVRISMFHRVVIGDFEKIITIARASSPANRIPNKSRHNLRVASISPVTIAE